MEYETEQHELTDTEIKTLLLPLNCDLEWEPDYSQDFLWSGLDLAIVPDNFYDDY